MSRRISSTVDEVVFVALGVNVVRHNRRKKKKKARFSISPVACYGFPGGCCCVWSFFGCVC